MGTMPDEHDDEPLLAPDEGAPICACGVTMLPDGAGGFACDNPDCEAYGESA